VAREYISLAEDISDESTIDVEIRPQIDNALGQEVIAARKAIQELGERQREVAALSRAAARDLAESGLSGADIAVVLDVSPQRVSQLLNA
jgi:DNA-directed RNA polymerase specialized sigma subunit